MDTVVSAAARRSPVALGTPPASGGASRRAPHRTGTRTRPVPSSVRSPAFGSPADHSHRTKLSHSASTRACSMDTVVSAAAQQSPAALGTPPASGGASRRALSRTGTRTRTRPVRSSVRSPTAMAVAQPQARRLFSSLAAYADIQSSIQLFENAVGRAAMVGFAVAVGTEALTADGLFSHLAFRDIAGFCSLTGMGMLSAAGIAGMAKNPLGLELREAVVKSLTSLPHSTDVASANLLDLVLDEVLDGELLEYLKSLE